MVGTTTTKERTRRHNVRNNQPILVEWFAEHTNTELESVIAKAKRQYQNDWKPRSPAERKAIVKKAASILLEKREDFAKLVTLEKRKLFREAEAEVDLSADILDYYADHAKKFLAPQKLKIDKGRRLVDPRRRVIAEY
jgi:succinate-semialdehyde dehydrogenase/glutarate-semialdehyde dehydrogenase